MGPGRLGGLVVAAALLAAGCAGSGRQALPPPTTPPGQPAVPTTVRLEPPRGDERRPQPVSFLVRAETCERFATAVRPVALAAVGPYGFNGPGSVAGNFGGAVPAAGTPAPSGAGSAGAAGAPMAPKAGVDFSGTNVQEAGVDEPDAVKTDGRLLVTTSDGRLRVLDVTGPPRQVGILELPAAGDLLLVGHRALVFSNPAAARFGPAMGMGSPGRPAGAPNEPGGRPTSTVTVVDLSDPAKPTVVRTHTIDGSYVDARLVGGVARLVTRSSPDISFPQPQVSSPQDAQRAQAANDAVVGRADPAAFLPKGASCADAYVPAEAAGASTIAVQSIDPAADAPGPAVTVMADATTVYASGTRLFVATNRYGGGGRGGRVPPAAGSRIAAPEAPRTAVHAFDITDPAKARYAGSGDVPGRLLNQFSLSEDAGVLRVATTIDRTSGGAPLPLPAGANDQGAPASSQPQPSQSRVAILRPTGEEWVETGAVEGLGTGEQIQAVRFLGTTGYVVTFRQTDPLYVLDLRDVRHPKVTGELKITGYSAYLHPAGDGRLLGIGQEATEQGRRMGSQVSLFDVADPSVPSKLAGAVLPSATSSAELDHHAFLFWPATGLLVTPVLAYGEAPVQPGAGGTGVRPFSGVVAFHIGDKSVAEVGRITHPGSTQIQRSLVVGDRLLTLSPVGLATNDLRTLADGGFLAFR